MEQHVDKDVSRQGESVLIIDSDGDTSIAMELSFTAPESGVENDAGSSCEPVATSSASANTAAMAQHVTPVPHGMLADTQPSTVGGSQYMYNTGQHSALAARDDTENVPGNQQPTAVPKMPFEHAQSTTLVNNSNPSRHAQGATHAAPSSAILQGQPSGSFTFQSLAAAATSTQRLSGLGSTSASISMGAATSAGRTGYKRPRSTSPSLDSHSDPPPRTFRGFASSHVRLPNSCEAGPSAARRASASEPTDGSSLRARAASSNAGSLALNGNAMAQRPDQRRVERRIQTNQGEIRQNVAVGQQSPVTASGTAIGPAMQDRPVRQQAPPAANDAAPNQNAARPNPVLEQLRHAIALSANPALRERLARLIANGAAAQDRPVGQQHPPAPAADAAQAAARRHLPQEQPRPAVTTLRDYLARMRAAGAPHPLPARALPDNQPRPQYERAADDVGAVAVQPGRPYLDALLAQLVERPDRVGHQRPPRPPNPLIRNAGALAPPMEADVDIDILPARNPMAAAPAVGGQRVIVGDMVRQPAAAGQPPAWVIPDELLERYRRHRRRVADAEVEALVAENARRVTDAIRRQLHGIMQNEDIEEPEPPSPVCQVLEKYGIDPQVFKRASQSRRLTDQDLLTLPDMPWDWALISKHKASLQQETLLALQNKAWDYQALSRLEWSNEVVLQLKDKNWDFHLLSKQRRSIELLSQTADKEWDWHHILATMAANPAAKDSLHSFVRKSLLLSGEVNWSWNRRFIDMSLRDALLSVALREVTSKSKEPWDYARLSSAPWFPIDAIISVGMDKPWDMDALSARHDLTTDHLFDILPHAKWNFEISNKNTHIVQATRRRREMLQAKAIVMKVACAPPHGRLYKRAVLEFKKHQAEAAFQPME